MKRIVLLLALCACPPNPQPAPHDAADGAILGTPENACESFARNGCKAGLDPQCVGVLAHVADAGLTIIDMTCIAKAQSKDATRACKGAADSCP